MKNSERISPDTPSIMTPSLRFQKLIVVAMTSSSLINVKVQRMESLSLGTCCSQPRRSSLNLRNWFRHRYNIPRRQQLGIVMTRGGRVTGFPLGSINTPNTADHPPQSISKDSKDSRIMRADSEDGERVCCAVGLNRFYDSHSAFRRRAALKLS